ncbi:MAG TPA: YtxH domain-containing protein [Candidatus Cloacimonetes bacterium]|nr:YtxH domain-containing protein [Candidatus Cloacimonadota bacterium]
MNRTLKFVFGAILGGILGSAIVLLYAPASGEESRLAIREKFSKYTEQLQTAVQEKREELKRELESYKEI